MPLKWVAVERLQATVEMGDVELLEGVVVGLCKDCPFVFRIATVELIRFVSQFQVINGERGFRFVVGYI